MSDDPYATLAEAILFWDLMDREGTRGQQIKAEHLLRNIAKDLRELGWSMEFRKKEK